MIGYYGAVRALNNYLIFEGSQDSQTTGLFVLCSQWKLMFLEAKTTDSERAIRVPLQGLNMMNACLRDIASMSFSRNIFIRILYRDFRINYLPPSSTLFSFFFF